MRCRSPVVAGLAAGAELGPDLGHPETAATTGGNFGRDEHALLDPAGDGPGMNAELARYVASGDQAFLGHTDDVMRRDGHGRRFCHDRLICHICHMCGSLDGVSRPVPLDPSRTDHCPLGHRCESCGGTGRGLAVVVVAVLGESLCLTLCPRCAASGRPPAIMLSTAEKLVAQHAAHLKAGGERRVDRTRTGGVSGS